MTTTRNVLEAETRNRPPSPRARGRAGVGASRALAGTLLGLLVWLPSLAGATHDGSGWYSDAGLDTWDGPGAGTVTWFGPFTDHGGPDGPAEPNFGDSRPGGDRNSDGSFPVAGTPAAWGNRIYVPRCQPSFDSWFDGEAPGFGNLLFPWTVEGTSPLAFREDVGNVSEMRNGDDNFDGDISTNDIGHLFFDNVWFSGFPVGVNVQSTTRNASVNVNGVEQGLDEDLSGFSDAAEAYAFALDPDNQTWAPNGAPKKPRAWVNTAGDPAFALAWFGNWTDGADGAGGGSFRDNVINLTGVNAATNNPEWVPYRGTAPHLRGFFDPYNFDLVDVTVTTDPDNGLGQALGGVDNLTGDPPPIDLLSSSSDFFTNATDYVIDRVGFLFDDPFPASVTNNGNEIANGITYFTSNPQETNANTTATGDCDVEIEYVQRADQRYESTATYLLDAVPGSQVTTVVWHDAEGDGGLADGSYLSAGHDRVDIDQYVCDCGPDGPEALSQSAREPVRFTSALYAADSAYMFGGWDGAARDQVLRFDPATRVWDGAGTLPSPRWATSAAWTGEPPLVPVAVGVGVGFVFGGHDGLTGLDQVLSFELPGERVGVVPAVLPTPRWGTSAAWTGDAVYVVGGRGEAGALDQVLRFDPATLTVTVTNASLPTPRWGTAAVWTGTHVLVFGGTNGTVTYDDVLAYDPQAGTVTLLPTYLPAPRHDVSAVWDGAFAYVYGGRDASAGVTGVVRYDPANANATLLSEALPSAQYGTSAVWDGVDEAWVFGGSSTGVPLRATPFTPPAAPLNVSSPTHPLPWAWYNRTQFNVSWAPTDASPTVDGYSYDLVLANATSSLDAVKDAEENVTSATFAGLAAWAPHVFRVRAVDADGAWGPVRAWRFGVDTIAPTFGFRFPLPGIPVVNPKAPVGILFDDRDNGQDFDQVYTQVDADAVQLIVDGVEVVATWGPVCAPRGPVVACRVDVSSGGVHYEPLVPWTEGVHELLARIRDAVVDGNEASTAWNFTHVPLWPVDLDADHVPDALEGEVCGRSLARTLLNVTTNGTLGRCPTSTDYQAPPPGVVVDVPVGVALGPDGDADAIPRDATVTALRLSVDPFRPGIVHVAPAPPQVYGLDANDSDPYDPVPQEVASPQALPVGVALGPDGDNDSIPHNVTVVRAVLVFNRTSTEPVSFRSAPATVVGVDANDSDPESPAPSRIVVAGVVGNVSFGPDADNDSIPANVTVGVGNLTLDRRTGHPLAMFEASQNQTYDLDPDDADPDNPAPSQGLVLSVPMAATHDGDADEDLVPGNVTITWLDVNANRTRDPPAWLSNHSTTSQLDADNGNATTPIPWNVVDSDLDRVPDASEFWICEIQNENTPTDGVCVAPDGTGSDGSDDNYVPPATPPNPWNLPPN